MKNVIIKSILVACLAVGFCGCRTVTVKDTSVKGRTVKFSLIHFEHTTDEATIGDVNAEKE